MKVCLASTSGGHLAQLEALAPAFVGHDAYLVTVRSAQAAWTFPQFPKFFVHQILRNPTGFFVNSFQSLTTLLREKPSVVVTTGAGDALPTAVFAASLGIPVLFVESMARVTRPSLFGRLVHRFAALTVIQWPGLADQYRGAVLAMPIFRPKSRVARPRSAASIVVLTGTHSQGFDRLLQAIDEMLANHEIQASVFAQIGHASYIPREYRYLRFMPHRDLVEHIREADLVITHDGAGSIGDALQLDKPILVIPRSSSKGEVSYRSKSDLARELAKLGWIRLVPDLRSLAVEIRDLKNDPSRLLPPYAPEVIDFVENFLNSLSEVPTNRIPSSAVHVKTQSQVGEHD